MRYYQKIIKDHGLLGIKAVAFPNKYRVWLNLEIVRIYRQVPRIKINRLDEDLRPTGEVFFIGDGLAFCRDLIGLPKLTDEIQ